MAHSPATPAKQPESDEAKRLLEQERDAIDNAREGYDDVPGLVTTDRPERTLKPETGGTEPTHVPSTDSDRR